MVHDEICVCGHPQSLHRTYDCNGPHPNPDPQKPTVSSVSAKHFKNGKLLTVKVWADYSGGSGSPQRLPPLVGRLRPVIARNPVTRK
jgi:hypothetical protein